MSIEPEGRRLLRVEKRNAQTPVERKPEWIRAELKIGPEYVGLKISCSPKAYTRCAKRPVAQIFSNAGKIAKRPSLSVAQNAPVAVTSVRLTLASLPHLIVQSHSRWP